MFLLLSLYTCATEALFTAAYSTAAGHSAECKAAGFCALCREGYASYLVVILRYHGTYNALIPDVPGCVALSSNIRKIRQLITEGLELHLQATLQSQLPLPEPKTSAHEYGSELDPEDELVEYGLLHVKPSDTGRTMWT